MESLLYTLGLINHGIVNAHSRRFHTLLELAAAKLGTKPSPQLASGQES